MGNITSFSDCGVPVNQPPLLLGLRRHREARAYLRGRHRAQLRTGHEGWRRDLYGALPGEQACRTLCAVIQTSSHGTPFRSAEPIWAKLSLWRATVSRDQLNVVVSAHMRCMMIASLRATATIARRKPRRLATAMPQAFSADHRWTRVSKVSAACTSTSRTAPSPVLVIEPLRSISPEAYLRGVKPKWR